jgi:hypothetical protein
MCIFRNARSMGSQGPSKSRRSILSSHSGLDCRTDWSIVCRRRVSCSRVSQGFSGLGQYQPELFRPVEGDPT